MLRQKPIKFCRKSYWKKQQFIFTVYLMNHVTSDVCTIVELKELNWVNIWKTSEAANLVFQFCTEFSKEQVLPCVSIAKHLYFHG